MLKFKKPKNCAVLWHCNNSITFLLFPELKNCTVFFHFLSFANIFSATKQRIKAALLYLFQGKHGQRRQSATSNPHKVNNQALFRFSTHRIIDSYHPRTPSILRCCRRYFHSRIARIATFDCFCTGKSLPDIYLEVDLRSADDIGRKMEGFGRWYCREIHRCDTDTDFPGKVTAFEVGSWIRRYRNG